MSDLISRQAAIDAMCKVCAITSNYHKCEGYQVGSQWCDEVVALRSLPPAQPERKKGKWTRISIDKYIRHAQAWYKCSECGGEFIGMFNYCGNCGAEMRGEKC